MSIESKENTRTPQPGIGNIGPIGYKKNYVHINGIEFWGEQRTMEYISSHVLDTVSGIVPHLSIHKAEHLFDFVRSVRINDRLFMYPEDIKNVLYNNLRVDKADPSKILICNPGDGYPFPEPHFED